MKVLVLASLAAALPAGAALAGPYDGQASGYAFEHPFIYSPNGAPEPVSHPLASGNECGVDRPVPIWGRNGAFLGYACENRPVTR